MYRYFIKIPWWLRKLYPAYVWKMPATEKTVYLTFDDGPHPTITPWVLQELKKYDAKATFFCIGKNVVSHPEVYQQILSEGHATANHSFNHLNGWKTRNDAYVKDVEAASDVIKSKLFRPPYGRVRKAQARELTNAMKPSKLKVVMWDVLSGDFDRAIKPEKCLKNVLSNTEPGSIIVFHDSDKAYENLLFSLPDVLKQLSAKGFSFRKIE